MVQKRRRVLCSKAHLKWTVSKWKSVLWADETKFDIIVGNHGRRVLRAKHATVPTMFKPVAGIKFEMNSFCTYFCKNFQLKHMLYVLLRIKYWLM